MVKAFVDLDMNGKDINSATNVTATGTVRSDTQFNRNGSNGLTSTFTVTQTDLTTHTFTFGGGILTNYTLGGGH